MCQKPLEKIMKRQSSLLELLLSVDVLENYIYIALSLSIYIYFFFLVDNVYETSQEIILIFQ